MILMLLLAVRLRCIIWDLSRSFLLRLAITIFSIILIYTMAQVNVVSLVLSSCSSPLLLSTSAPPLPSTPLSSPLPVHV